MGYDDVRAIASHKGKICREILDDLPDWFGIPAAVDNYVRAVEELPMFGCVGDGAIAGFIAVKRHFDATAEAYVLGVKRAWHRRGIGRRLFAHVEEVLRRERCAYLTVKTVSAERSDEAYADTRRFYEAIGFLPVEVFPTLWGPENPCLLMIKSLARQRLT